MGSVIKKRRRRLAKTTHRLLLMRTRVQRLKNKSPTAVGEPGARPPPGGVGPGAFRDGSGFLRRAADPVVFAPSVR
ncbi:30S ribosomal protein bS22 [[Kitasatospora] papulosa]